LNAFECMRKATRSLRAARMLFENGFMDDASSRAYYAMFDAARAALLAANAPVEAEVARSHKGLIAAFGKHIVKPGMIAPDIGRSLGQAQHVRLIADYSGDPVEAKDADRMLLWAASFVDAITERFGLNDDALPPRKGAPP